MQDEKIIVIDINLTRGLMVLLVLALLMVTFIGYLAWGQREAVASSPQAPVAASTGMRQYYLTKDAYNGKEALTACASSYHMASLWEILDPSNLKYNTTLGQTQEDSGQGLPTGLYGWVRTGYDRSTATTAGQGNCDAWTSNDNAYYGTRALMNANWTAADDIHVWVTQVFWCDFGFQVWCVED